MADKLTKQEIEDRDALFEYVKKLLGYDENMKIPKHLVSRLLGMQRGQFIANNHAKAGACYSFKVIHLTFMACASTIRNCLSTVNFNGEQHKINYVMSIIDKNINDMYLRTLSAKKTEEQIAKIDIQHTENQEEYKPKSKPVSIQDLLGDDF